MVPHAECSPRGWNRSNEMRHEVRSERHACPADPPLQSGAMSYTESPHQEALFTGLLPPKRSAICPCHRRSKPAPRFLRATIPEGYPWIHDGGPNGAAACSQPRRATRRAGRRQPFRPVTAPRLAARMPQAAAPGPQVASAAQRSPTHPRKPSPARAKGSPCFHKRWRLCTRVTRVQQPFPCSSKRCARWQ